MQRLSDDYLIFTKNIFAVSANTDIRGCFILPYSYINIFHLGPIYVFYDMH